MLFAVIVIVATYFIDSFRFIMKNAIQDFRKSVLFTNYQNCYWIINLTYFIPIGFHFNFQKPIYLNPS